MTVFFRVYRWTVVVAVASAMVACGGGGSAGLESAGSGTPTSADQTSPATSSTQGSLILNEWLQYADPDEAQGQTATLDSTEVQLGKAARINRETLDAKRTASGRQQSELPGVASRKTGYTNLVPVYRFFNRNTAVHFYTISDVERDQVIASAPWYQYEGVAFQVSATQQGGLAPVYRFFNATTGAYLYTISEEEKDLILANIPSFQLEGIAYYASPVPGEGLSALYRFYRRDRRLHFFTAQYTERDTTINTGCSYRYEGISYYVFGGDSIPNPPEARPNAMVLVVGDSLSKGYGISLGGNPYNFVSKGKVWTERLATEVRTRTGRICNRVVDVSIGGMRTVEGANGIQNWLDLYAPTHVILAQGTNDAWQNRGVSSMSANIDTMAQASKSAGSNVYVMEFAFYPKGTAYRQGMTAMYQGAASRNGVHYFAGSGGVPANGTYYHPDSVHLRDAAQPIVLENVWAALLPYL